MYPKKEKGWWNAVKSFWKGSFEDKILADTELATELFMPSKDEILKCLSQELPQESKTAEDLLRVVFMVFSSMKVQMLDRDLRNADDDLRTKVNVYCT